MPILTTDLLAKFSVAAAAGDTTVGTAAGSLGDQVSTTQITSVTLNNLFRHITGAESAAGITLYRCIFVHNNHASLTWANAIVKEASETASGGTIAFATDNIGVTAKGSGSAQAATIASETTAPTGVSAFGTSELSLGSVGPGEVVPVWLRLTIPPGTSAINPDGVIMEFDGDTLP
jgi:hypothetical protein